MINHNKSIRNNLHKELEWFNNNNNGRVDKLKRKRNEAFEFATREYLNQHCSSSQNDWNKLSINRSWGSHIDIGTTKKITKQPERAFGVKKESYSFKSERIFVLVIFFIPPILFVL